jgi:hypothetical protein
VEPSDELLVQAGLEPRHRLRCTKNQERALN